MVIMKAKTSKLFDSLRIQCNKIGWFDDSQPFGLTFHLTRAYYYSLRLERHFTNIGDHLKK
jgi:hypothetical protein